MQKQDDFKRTQVRMPQDLYEKLVEFAERENISLNSSILKLIDTALSIDDVENRRIMCNRIVDSDGGNVDQSNYLLDRLTEIFNQHPTWRLITTETVLDGRGVRYWYTYPKSEDNKR